MNQIVDVPAPAKLNLFLHVLGRRADGYHTIQSAFVLIDWHDVLHFEKRTDGRIVRLDLGRELPADDLCVRAARALQSAAGVTNGATISIDKRVPDQAGMGGGSSDAATCLLALNRLWRTGLDRAQLEQLASTLGADVPFFVRGRNAWVEGVGERITPCTVPTARYLVIKPPQGVSTAALFAHPDLPRDTAPAIISGFAAIPFGFGRNDLQVLASESCPSVGRALRTLEQIGLRARMTGSGSAVFAWLGPDASPTLAAQIPVDVGEARVCTGLEAHPLAEWV